jgi:ADP-ribosylglycohydrolase
MSYLYALAVIGLLYLAMHFFTELTHRQKLAVSGVLILIVAAAALYNRSVERRQAYVRQMILNFNQHFTLECRGVEVSDKEFTLSVGTQSFIGNEGTPHAGEIFAASECE